MPTCYLHSGNSSLTKTIGSLATSVGFGSGKTFALAAKILYLGMANPGSTLMALEPTFPMLRTVLFPTFDACFEQWGVEFTFRVSPQPEYLLHLPTGTVKVLASPPRTGSASVARTSRRQSGMRPTR